MTSGARTYLLLVPMVLFASTGNVLLGKGMKQASAVKLGSPAAVASLFVKAFGNGCVWLGIGCLLLFLVSIAGARQHHQAIKTVGLDSAPSIIKRGARISRHVASASSRL